MTIDHGYNDPFVRAAHQATAEGQTETVYAVKVTYRTPGGVEYWNASPTPPTEKQIQGVRDTVYRQWRERPVVRVEGVSRAITISATPWAALPGTDKEKP